MSGEVVIQINICVINRQNLFICRFLKLISSRCYYYYRFVIERNSLPTYMCCCIEKYPCIDSAFKSVNICKMSYLDICIYDTPNITLFKCRTRLRHSLRHLHFVCKCYCYLVWCSKYIVG